MQVKSNLYIEDEVIIREYVDNKSNRAANAFVRKYQSFVYHTAYRYVNNYEDADEITQEVFIKALFNLHKFNNQSSIKTWLYTITKNLCYTFKLKNKFLNIFVRNKKDQIDILDNLSFNDIPYNTQTPDNILEFKELNDKFEEVLKTLPEKQKETFALRYFDNLSYKEISELLNITEGGVKANYFQATKKIATEINKFKSEINTLNK